MSIFSLIGGDKGPCKECGHPTFHENHCAVDILDNWKRCPSTHCERTQECRNPGDCSGTGRGRTSTSFAKGGAA